jgi:hypothetical protein
MKKGKNKTIVEKIFEEVYNFELIFIAGYGFDEANKKIGEFGLEIMPDAIRSSSGASCRFTEEDYPKTVKGTIYVVWVKNRKDFYCLLHEVSHLLIKVFEDKGMEVNDHTTEAFAYYQEFWFRKLWRLMNK